MGSQGGARRSNCISPSHTRSGDKTLTGDDVGIGSLTVTRNIRLTFRIDSIAHEICELNLEDYH